MNLENILPITVFGRVKLQILNIDVWWIINFRYKFLFTEPRILDLLCSLTDFSQFSRKNSLVKTQDFHSFSSIVTFKKQDFSPQFAENNWLCRSLQLIPHRSNWLHIKNWICMLFFTAIILVITLCKVIKTTFTWLFPPLIWDTWRKGQLIFTLWPNWPCGQTILIKNLILFFSFHFVVFKSGSFLDNLQWN